MVLDRRVVFHRGTTVYGIFSALGTQGGLAQEGGLSWKDYCMAFSALDIKFFPFVQNFIDLSIFTFFSDCSFRPPKSKCALPPLPIFHEGTI